MPRENTISSARLKLALAVLTYAVAIGLALWVVDTSVRGAARKSASAAARDDAAIMATGLKSELDKFSLVPLVLAQDPQVQAALSGRAGDIRDLDRRLETLARQTDASAIYLMNAKGDTLAASNWQLETSFVGSNYSFRRYFKAALVTGTSTQFALGTVSRKPGLYIAHRVMAGGRPAGIVAVKVEFDALEAHWRSASDGVFVTDRNGVVLLTSNSAWRFHVAKGSAAAQRDPTLDRQQFGADRLPPLELGLTGSSDRLVEAPLLDTQQPIPLDGWVLHLLVDPSSQISASVANARFYSLLALALLAALIGTAVFLRRRRKVQAEQVLARRTQTLRDQLHQANRLATLGQVSAGVGHEISQPVAAARLFAENGEALLAAGKLDDARTNFDRIVGLMDKIGKITAELRRFSRRDAPEPEEMPLATAIDGAVLLLRDRMRSMDVTVTTPSAEQAAIRVRAEPVRLEQVLVNLLQNALDASDRNGRLDIALAADAGRCFLTVSDSGPGINPDVAERLFQPFATTKADGLGLGLVISRDIMRDLGGDLTVQPRQSGAQFVMEIPRA